MRAVRVHQFGDPSVMKVENIPIPEPAGNEVLVHVKAAGVNPADTHQRAGGYHSPSKLPYTPGFDAAGIVEKVGADVTRFKKGDRVFMCTPNGTYAEYVITYENRLFVLPDNVTFEEGAAFGVPYLTAYRMLFQNTKLRPDHTFFVHGASGAVGLACVQMARRAGVKQVIGTAGTDEAIKMLSHESLCGEGNVYNHRSPTYLDDLKKRFPNGFDRIAEVLGDVNLGHDVELAAPRGEIIVVGARGLSKNVNSTRIMMLELRIVGVLLSLASSEDFQEAGRVTSEAAKEGFAKPVISFTFPLEKAAEAHAKVMLPSKLPGKILLLP